MIAKSADKAVFFPVKFVIFVRCHFSIFGACGALLGSDRGGNGDEYYS